MTLKIRALGDFQLTIKGEDVTSRLDATRIFLLTYLADTGQPKPRTHLAELLWPERPPGQARSNLRTLLTRLRPLLGDYLHIAPATVALATEQVWFDVQAFTALVAQEQSLPQSLDDEPPRHQALAAAVALFQGDFLATLTCQGSDALESWFMTRRLQLHGQAVQSLQQLVQSPHFALDERIAFARKRLTLEPLDEAACRSLMGLLAENGQRDEALWHFQRYQRELAEVWSSATPSEELVMLAAKIRLGMAVDATTLVQTVQGATHLHAASKPSPATAGQPATSADHHQPTLPPAGTAPDAHPFLLRPFPAPLKPLIGREQERAQLLQWLNLGYRLIAVTGLGGVGKSHFVQTVVAAEKERWRAGGMYVTIAEGTSGAEAQRPTDAQEAQRRAVLLLCRTITAALNLPLQSGQAYTEQLAQALAPYASCLILDNFEQLLPAAPYLQTLLSKAGKLTIIAISRRPLHLAAAVQIALKGLPQQRTMHGADAPTTARTQAAQPDAGTAEELLTLNLSRHLPERQLSEQEQALLSEICQAVHGLPLALEMVPALVRHLSLAEVAIRLRTEPLTLTADFADLPVQHRSLYTLMDATFTVAARPLQEALVRLAVFAGPFTVDAALCVVNRKQVNELNALSWIEPIGAALFALHPLVAAFVRSLCADQQWAIIYAQARRTHARYYAKAITHQPFFQNSYYTAGIAWLRQHFAEVTNACQMLLAENADDAVPLLHAITMYGHHFGDHQTVQQWLQRGLAVLPSAHPARLPLLIDYVTCMTELREMAAADTALAEIRTAAVAQQDQTALLALYERLGWAAQLDYAAATPQRRQEGRHYFAQGVQLAEAMGNQQQIVNMLAQRAFLASWDPAGYPQAQLDLQRAVALAHQLDQPGLQGMIYKTFAYLEFAAGHFALAQRYSDRAIQLFTAEADTAMTLGWLYMERSQIALAQRELSSARDYLTLADTIFRPAAYEAGLTQCHTLQGIVALLAGDPTGAERSWLRAYRAVQQMTQQDKLTVTLTLGVGVTQLLNGDPLLGAQLVAVARAQYDEKAFHWVAPEQKLMAYLLERAATEIELLALPPISVDGKVATQSLLLLAGANVS